MTKLDKDLFETMMRLMRAMHGYRGMQMGGGHFANPHRGQGRVLAMLKMQPEISQKELGYLLDMRNQSLGELLGKLEQKGYITRTPSEEDKRTAVIRLTEEGRKAAEDVEEKREESGQMFQALSDEEKEQLLLLLTRLLQSFEENGAGKETDRDAFMKAFDKGMRDRHDRHPFRNKGWGGPEWERHE